MKTCTPYSLVSALVLTLIASPCLVSAQTSSPSPLRTDTKNTTVSSDQSDIHTNEEGEIITLEEFTVSSSSLKDTYIASETTAGIRTKDEIINLPYNVQVFTSDFIDDFQLYDDQDFFQFVSGATTGTGATTVRGFEVTKLYNGFPYGLAPKTINSGQTEVMKGAASAFYGRTNPGGIVNKIAKRPKSKKEYLTKVSANTADYYYVGASATGALAKNLLNNKLFYYAYSEYSHRKGGTNNYEVDFQKSETYFFGLSLMYMFKPSTSLTVTYEYAPEKTDEFMNVTLWYPQNNPDPDGLPQYSYQGIGSFNPRGPYSYRDYKFHGFNVLLEHRIDRTWSTRASVQGQSKDTDKTRWSGASSFYEGPVSFSLGTQPYPEFTSDVGSLVKVGNTYFWQTTDAFSERYPYSDDNLNQSVALQAELVGNFRTSGAEHRVFFTFDSSLNRTDDDARIWPTETRNLLPITTRFLNINKPYWVDFDRSLVTQRNTYRRVEQITAGGLASYSGKYFNQRLITMASLRLDYIRDKIEDKMPASAVNQVAGDQGTRTDTAITYSIGATYKIRGDDLVTFLNYSTGYIPKNNVDNGTKELVKPYESWGFDFGVKGAGQNNKFGYTISGYYMQQENVLFENLGYNSSYAGQGIIAQYISGGVERAYGVDFDTFYKPIASLTLRLNIGWVHSRVRKNDANPWLEGSPRPGVAPWSGALLASYNFRTGMLKGLTIGLTASYIGRHRDQMDNFSRDWSSQTRREHYVPSLFLMRMNMNYSFKVGKTIHKPSLAFSNLLNRKYYFTNGREARGIVAFGGYTVTF